MKRPFPISSLRTTFDAHFQDGTAKRWFTDLCDIIEGNIDPWTKITSLQLRMHGYNDLGIDYGADVEDGETEEDTLVDEETEIEDWLINTGYFISTVKGFIITSPKATFDEVTRLCAWFTGQLDAARDDFLDEEIHYLEALWFQAGLLPFYAIDALGKDVKGARVASLNAITGTFKERVSSLNDDASVKACSLVIPHVLDLLKVHPARAGFLLGYLDEIIDLMRERGSGAESDDATGLCVRTLAFKAPGVSSPKEHFEWAVNAVDSIDDSFTRTTATINLAIGHATRGETDAAETLFRAMLVTSYELPTPRKEIQVCFLARGTIVAGLSSSEVHKDVMTVFQSLIDTTLETITSLSVSMDSQLEQAKNDLEIDALMEDMELTFVIISAILDNLALAGLDVKNTRWLGKVEEIIQKVQELNLELLFLPKLALYYTLLDPKGKKHETNTARLLESVNMTVNQEMEHVFLDDLLDFFAEYAKDLLELAYVTGDEKYLLDLEKAFVLIKSTKKELEDVDVQSLRFELLGAMHGIVSKMWEDLHGVQLLQGLPGAL